MTETIFAGKMPILALRGLCVFPEQTVHFEVGRSKSVKALEAAMQGDQTLLTPELYAFLLHLPVQCHLC